MSAPLHSYDAPVVARLGDEALGALVRLLGWAALHGDAIPPECAARFGVRKRTWGRLVEAGTVAAEGRGFLLLPAARELFGLGFAGTSNASSGPAPEARDRSPAAVVEVKCARSTRALSMSPEAIRKRLKRAAAAAMAGQAAGHHPAVSGQIAAEPGMSGDTAAERPAMASAARAVSLSSEDPRDQVSGSEGSSRISSLSSPCGSSLSSGLEVQDRAREGAGEGAKPATGRHADRTPDNDGGRPRVRLVDDSGERPMPTPNELPAAGSAPPDFVESVLAEVHMSEGVPLPAGATWRAFLDNAHRRRAEGLSAWATAEHFRAWARKDARGGGARPASRGRTVQQDPPGPKAYQVASPDDPWGDGPLYAPGSPAPAWAASTALAPGLDLRDEWGRFTRFSAKRTSPIAPDEGAWKAAWESWLENPRPTSRARRSVVQGGPVSGPRMSFDDSDEDFPMPPLPLPPAASGDGGRS